MTSVTGITELSPEIGPGSAIWTLLGVDRAAQDRSTFTAQGDMVDRAAQYLARLCRASESASPGIPANASRHLLSHLEMQDRQDNGHSFSYPLVLVIDEATDADKDDLVVWWPSAFREVMNETVLRSAPKCVLGFADPER
jgi:hypothetical protein